MFNCIISLTYLKFKLEFFPPHDYQKTWSWARFNIPLNTL